MDVEDLKDEPAPLKNTNSDISRILHQKRNLYRQSTQPQLPSLQNVQEHSVVWQPHVSQVQGQPLPQQVYAQPAQVYQTPAFLQGSQAAVANPGAANMPPLFVGFLTNDVSMNQIRQLFTSYTKAANEVKTESRLIDKTTRQADKRGRFDLRHLEVSDNESEEEISLGKRDHDSKAKKDLK